MIEPPEVEKFVGMEVYFTKSKGFGGVLKRNPEDFIVEEIPIEIPRKEDGPFLAMKIRAKNWETFRLFNEMAKRLGLRTSQIRFAGTKDKRAITTQWIVVPIRNEEYVLRKISRIRNLEVLEYYHTDHMLTLGELQGNRFEITIREVSEDAEEIFYSVKSELDSIGGRFPNFYGIQRFGTVRPITHVVGRLLIEGKYEEALLELIGHPFPGESEEVVEARKYLYETRDYEGAYRRFPERVGFEKKMLEHLVRHPGDFVGAFRSLPKALRLIYIYAYQSYLFNRILSERIRRELPISEPIEGDIIIPLVRPITTELSRGIYVDKWNLEKARKKVKEGKAFVTGLVPGTSAKIARGVPGEIERKILEEEGVSPKDFVVPKLPELTSDGTRRALSVPVKWLGWSFPPGCVKMSFELYKGCYATCLLREFMKAKDVKAYG